MHRPPHLWDNPASLFSQEIADLGEKNDVLGRRRRLGGCFLLLLAHGIDALDKHEDREGDDQATIATETRSVGSGSKHQIANQAVDMG